MPEIDLSQLVFLMTEDFTNELARKEKVYLCKEKKEEEEKKKGLKRFSG